MTTMQWLMVIIFFATFAGLFKFQRYPERVFAVTSLICLAFSYVSSEQILHNAVNPGLITLVLLVLCSFAFERTSILRKFASVLINGSAFSSTLKTLVSTIFSSAFMSNTAVVATLISTIKKNTLINPGKLLLPLSFVAILGGTLTLVGTSTNLIVNSMLIETGAESLGFFDFFTVGISAVVVCLLVIIFRMPSLPDMETGNMQMSDYFLEAEINTDSKLIGKSVENNGLRSLDSLFLVEVVRAGHLISPVKPEEILQAGDKLIFTGDISKVLTIQQFDGLSLFADKDGLIKDNLTEVLIKPDSAVVGKTLKSAGFRARFDAAVVAIKREGGQLSGKLGDIVIQSGDFLVLAVGNDFRSRTNLSKNFYIISGHEPDNMLHGWRDWLTVGGFFLTIGVSVLLNVPLLTSLIFYTAVLVASKCLTINEIKRRFPLEIWMIVLGALTLAKALETSGVANVVAQNIELLLQGKSIYIAFIVIYFITLISTELVTNNAAAALMFPIAYSMAIGLGVDVMPFVMAVAFAASGSFISPYGYQTNVMVYNAGNYSLAEFIRFGVPVSIFYSVVVLIMIPIVFPF